MDIIGDTIDRCTALSADSLCEAALDAFIHDLDCRALAVVDGERPVAIVHREPFLARMERTGAASRPILEIAEPDPLIVDADLAVTPFVARMLAERPAALLGGFIVCADGRYAGVSDLARLLPALTAPHKDVGLIERICTEVREPVAHALAAAEGLQRLRLPEGASAHIETIAEAAQTTLSLLDTAAELQRADAGRLEIAVAPRRLQELMDDIAARWRVQAEIAGATLLVSYDGAPDCAAVVDGARLMQVFDALIGHAMAHSSRGVIEASLKVRAEEGGYVLTGRVRDNGATYAPDHLAGLFRGFAETVVAGGMGVQLELMLAQRTIAAMSGSLVAQPNPGPGATVSFEVAVPAGEERGADDASMAELAPTRSAHILVVDDNATNRMVVEALCEMFDCSTESVVDGVEAVEAARAGRYDVILMDIKMPRMDGVTAAKEIRKLSAPAGRVPIIALTANADTDEVALYLAAGMRSVVEKPIKPERLLEALDGALAERHAQEAAAAA
jgi:CheY-like chemotaxis protein